MADSFNKKEREKRKQKKKKEKAQKKEERKEQDGKSTDDFMYLDEDGNLSSTPPDPNKKRKEIKLEDIQISPPKREKADPADGIRNGTVKFFNTEKGYGFIIDDQTKESYFVHIGDLIDEIKENHKVSFEIGAGPKGPVALTVKRI